MSKKTYFFIDDVIWVFRDITRQKPAHIFDNPFLAVLKKAHDNYGLKVQLNVFCRTDFYYGSDEFTLAEMTDAYKEEWIANADWLKFGFHAKQEFPDYPYVNASYKDVKTDFDYTIAQIKRFAGIECFSYATCTHWLPMSKEGCKALYDGGIRIISVSYGDRAEYDGNPDSLPYGHAFRLLQNRKSETMTFTRKSLNAAIERSICGYNHITEEQLQPTLKTLKYHHDEETGMNFKKFTNGPCLNLSTLEGLDDEMAEVIGDEYVGYATHEQYFYSDYFAYQPDYAEKIYKAAKILHDNGYEHIFADELVK